MSVCARECYNVCINIVVKVYFWDYKKEIIFKEFNYCLFDEELLSYIDAEKQLIIWWHCVSHQRETGIWQTHLDREELEESQSWANKIMEICQSWAMQWSTRDESALNQKRAKSKPAISLGRSRREKERAIEEPGERESQFWARKVIHKTEKMRDAIEK